MNGRRDSRTVSALVVLALAVIVLGLAGACARGRPESVVLEYYYEVICPSCPESVRSELQGSEVRLLGNVHDHVSAESRDVMHGDGMERLRQTALKHDVDTNALMLPILFVNGELYVGFDAIDEYLRTWGK
ncbi:MAG: hypothetical protein EA382_05560 [Spirochaetaceae bacterium]|nr:MAG: hypothetical protein EA382_05560 [Spirochaetaceae bacterium]